MKRIALLATLASLVAACQGGLPSIPVGTGGSITVVDGGATVCTTIPLAVAVDAGVVR